MLKQSINKSSLSLLYILGRWSIIDNTTAPFCCIHSFLEAHIEGYRQEISGFFNWRMKEALLILMVLGIWIFSIFKFIRYELLLAGREASQLYKGGSTNIMVTLRRIRGGGTEFFLTCWRGGGSLFFRQHGGGGHTQIWGLTLVNIKTFN